MTLNAKRYMLYPILLFALVASLFARTTTNTYQRKRKEDFMWYRKNQWALTITNYGTFGYGKGSPGGEWPRGSGNMYIYGAGIWIGVRPSRSETLVTCGYNPSSGKSEFTTGCWENAPGGYEGREFERIYVYPEDWPPNPNDFPESMRDSFPTYLRIPLSATDTVRGYFYPIPRTSISTADAWCVFNDRDRTQHVAPAKPCSVEVYQTTYSWNLPKNRDIVFFTLTVKNVSKTTLKNVYLGMVCDADIGGSTDDMCGLILRKYIKNRQGTDSVFVDNVGYVYDYDFNENWSTPPGYVGFDFLQSPYAFTDGIDNNHNGVIDEGPDGLDGLIIGNDTIIKPNGLIDEPSELEQLGMVSYKMFTLQAGDPRNDYEQYLAMAGYNYWQISPEYAPYDSIDLSPADKRFLQSTGPFDLPPDSLATITIAVIAAPSNPIGGVGDLYPLAVASSSAQLAYDNNWISPDPPQSPHLTLIPGEGRITLIWDDYSEKIKDRYYPYSRALLDLHYREYDFQGYKVWRSQTGNVGDWILLDQFDKIDGITFEDTTVEEAIRTKATDKGLRYSYIDSVNIRLGFPYYYAVTAFDLNTMGAAPDTSWLSLESGIEPKVAVARTKPTNYTSAQFKINKLRGDEHLDLTLQPTALVNHAIKPEKYLLRFLPPQPTGKIDTQIPLYRFYVQNQNGDTLVPIQSFVLDIRHKTEPQNFHPTIFDSSVVINIKQPTDTSTRLDTTKAYMPIIDLAFSLSMDSVPFQFFDRIDVKRQTYPKDSLQLPTELTYNKALWAYRGSDFQIVFKEKYPNGPITAEVFDLSLNQPVPYRRMGRTVVNTPDADSADGWSFSGLTPAEGLGSDTVVPNKTRYLLLCGGQINLNMGYPISSRLMPLPGDTWIVYSRRIKASPAYSEFEIVSFPMVISDSIHKLNVKVVPNPYLVRNEWERHPDYRKLKFINLPDECTIRIYNFAGDLIKTIKHSATKTQAPGNVPLQAGGDEDWDLLSESGQKPAPGIYLFHIESKVGNQIGKFVIIY
ncbi:MAG: hypothetical protein ABIK61_07105 [candidate division WOR-3 bacterium]